MLRCLTAVLVVVVSLASVACAEDAPSVPLLNAKTKNKKTSTSKTLPVEDAGLSAAVPVEAGSTPTPDELHLSDLTVQVVTNGFGPIERNASNGDDQEGDGKPMVLNGVTYSKGLGVHAPSEVLVALNGQYKEFTSDIGVDDEVGEAGSIVFQVFADDELLFDSGTMTGASDTKKVLVGVAGKQTLKLVVTDAADDASSDHADWAGARLAK